MVAPVKAGLGERERPKVDYERIKTRYGVETLDDILLIAATEAELAECDACTGYPCRKSHHIGYKPVIDNLRGEVVISTPSQCPIYAQHARQKALERKFSLAKIPVRCIGKTLEDYAVDDDNRNAVEFAKRILTEGFSGAYFYGEVGTGKTFLAAIIAQDFLRADKTVLFGKVADLLTEFYEIYRGQDDKSERELLRRLYEVDLLVLDDFGIEKSTQYLGTTLCKILDARYNRTGITTLITSNHTLKDIRRRLNSPSDADKDVPCLNGTRIYDRLIEICKPINFKGKSRRQ